MWSYSTIYDVASLFGVYGGELIMDKCSITRCNSSHYHNFPVHGCSTNKWLLVDLILQQARTHHFIHSMQNYCILQTTVLLDCQIYYYFKLLFTLLLKLQLNHFHNYESHEQLDYHVNQAERRVYLYSFMPRPHPLTRKRVW